MTAIKIYARQVPPEYQESPLQLCDEAPENVYVFGNRDYIGIRADEIGDIYNALEELADDFDFSPDEAHFIEKADGSDYTPEEWKKLAQLAREYAGIIPGKGRSDRECARDALALIYGEPFTLCTLRGSCQGDWQYCIYPAAYGYNFREAFETEYFNTGSEWIIHDGDDAPEEPEDINGYSIYCYSYDPRAEIAADHGVQPEEVRLYTFAGYTRRASWEVA